MNGAGIEAVVAAESRDVLDMMERVKPDLVLMDLHMPGMRGTELTALIRAHEAFLHTPIVFLTGDPDPEKQFEVLEVRRRRFPAEAHPPAPPDRRGGEPRQARTRARQAAHDRSQPPSGDRPDGAPGVCCSSLSTALPANAGGVYFLEIEGTSTLRERFGYAALERLMTEAGRRLGALAGAHPATRLNDHSFLIYTPSLEDLALDRQARVLARRLSADSRSMSTAIRCSCASPSGYTALRARLHRCRAARCEAAEQASRHARSQALGIFAFEPPDHGARRATCPMTCATRSPTTASN